MMRPIQYALFGKSKPCVPYVKDSPTSEQAARKVKRTKALEDRAAILYAIKNHLPPYNGGKGEVSPFGLPIGLTDDDLAQLCPKVGANSLRARRGELVRAGLIVDSGRTRPTRSGRQAVVWVAV